MKNFIRWFIMFCGIVVVSYFAYIKGILSLIYKSDVSYISVIISVLFIILSIFTGCLAYKVDKIGLFNVENQLGIINKQLSISKFCAENFVTLGLLGTCVGFCMMLYGSLNAANDVKVIIEQLKIGSSVALYTTLVGLICSLLLQLQVFVLEYDINN